MKRTIILLAILMFTVFAFSACSTAEESGDNTTEMTEAGYQETTDEVGAAGGEPAESHTEASESEMPMALDPATVVPPIIGQTGFTLVESAASSPEHYEGTVYYAVELTNPNEEVVLDEILLDVTAYSEDDTPYPADNPVTGIQLYPQETIVVSGTISVGQPIVRIEAQVSQTQQYEAWPLSSVPRPKYMTPIVSDLTFHDACFVSGTVMNPNDFDVTCNIWIALRDAAGNPVAGALLAETLKGGKTRSFDINIPVYGLGLRSPESLSIAGITASVELESVLV